MAVLKLNEERLPSTEDTASLVSMALRVAAESAFVPWATVWADESERRRANDAVADALTQVIEACNALMVLGDRKLATVVRLCMTMPSDEQADGVPLEASEADRRRRSYLTLVRQLAREVIRRPDLVVEGEAATTVEYWKRRAMEAEAKLENVRGVLAEVAKGGGDAA